MSEQTYAEAQGVGWVAAAMLAVAILVGATFVIIGLTAGPPVLPNAAASPAAPATDTPVPAAETAPATDAMAPAPEAAPAN